MASGAPVSVMKRLMYSPVNYWIVLVFDLAGAVAFLMLAVNHYAGRPVSAAIAAVLGFVAWGFLEYVLHRWILHGRHSMARQGHAQHHADPTALISTPIFVMMLLFVIIWALLRLVLSDAVAAFAVFGLYTGYNYFVIVHHWQHHRPQDLARVAYLQRLEHLHHSHHTRQIVNFGISTTMWDRLFRTYRDPD
jgi:4-hydroxysphinganine ceramide fatty acyl 2-hydroxylase